MCVRTEANVKRFEGLVKDDCMVLEWDRGGVGNETAGLVLSDQERNYGRKERLTKEECGFVFVL
jgi:hypothetical protein